MAERMSSTETESTLQAHRAGRLDEAEAGYRRHLREGRREMEFPFAVLLLQRARYAEALPLLERLAAAEPDNADVAANLSIALRHDGRLEEALQTARRASESAPDKVQGWNALGLAALQLDRADEALRAFEAGLALDPRSAAMALHRGHCLRRLGRYDAAAQAFSRLGQVAPQWIEGWRGLAQVQATAGQLQAALHSRQRARALAPGDAEVEREYAIALLRTGAAAEAAHCLEQLLRAHPQEAQAWFWLGRARLAREETTAAREAFEQARRLDPDDAEIAHACVALSGALPEHVESDYIRSFFDEFAEHFDHTLVNRLAYDIPQRLTQFLRRHDALADRVLDLGCGTGLMAVELQQPALLIDGVDLSPKMLRQAAARNLYRTLHEGEIAQFLRGTQERWELIVAADVFVYVADLRAIFDGVFDHLAPGGHFAFSIERSGNGATELLPQTGRYRHDGARLTQELAAAGFVDVVREAAVLRQEQQKPVEGEFLIARRGEG